VVLLGQIHRRLVVLPERVGEVLGSPLEPVVDQPLFRTRDLLFLGRPVEPR
jgi:hypothetical protein